MSRNSDSLASNHGRASLRGLPERKPQIVHLRPRLHASDDFRLVGVLDYHSGLVGSGVKNAPSRPRSLSTGGWIRTMAGDSIGSAPVMGRECVISAQRDAFCGHDGHAGTRTLKRACSGCGNEFQPGRPWQKQRSPRCRQRAYVRRCATATISIKFGVPRLPLHPDGGQPHVGIPLCTSIRTKPERMVPRKTKVIGTSFVHKSESAGRHRVPRVRRNGIESVS
jgi:hypothetical protein